MGEAGKVVVIGGPSGSGESTITNALIVLLPKASRLVTATTRPRRDDERDMVDYYFFSESRFLDDVAKGNIIEHTYIENRNTYYGSYRPDLEKRFLAGGVIFVNPDLVGTKYYKDHYGALTIFIEPDSLETLRRRVRERSPHLSEDEINKRMENARHEIENEKPYYDYCVTNAQGKLGEAVAKVKAIIESHLEK